jgi:hypothetical protein
MNRKLDEQTFNFSEYKEKCFQLLQVNDALNIAIEDKNREIARFNDKKTDTRLEEIRLEQLYLDNEELQNLINQKNQDFDLLYEQTNELSGNLLRTEVLLTEARGEASENNTRLKRLLSANEYLNQIVDNLSEDIERARTDHRMAQARSEQRIASLVEERIKLSEMNTSQTSKSLIYILYILIEEIDNFHF